MRFIELLCEHMLCILLCTLYDAVKKKQFVCQHCLVTKHTNVVVSGQTVKTCLIKH